MKKPAASPNRPDNTACTAGVASVPSGAARASLPPQASGPSIPVAAPTAAEIRDVSHMMAELSEMLRSEALPTHRRWMQTRDRYPADKALEVSHWLLERAKNMEARGES